MPTSLRVLRERNYRLLFFGQGTSLLGDRMFRVALAFAVLGIGGSASDVGLVFAAGMLPLVGSLLAGGVVADRLPRRAVMVVADLVRVAGQGAMAFLLIAGSAEVWTLAVLAGVTGAATGFFTPAATGLLPMVVSAGQLQQANALRGMAMSGAEIVGPVLAGIMVATIGAGWAIAFDAVSFAVSAALLMQLRLPPQEALETSSFLADLREGWDVFRSRSWVWTIVAAAAVSNILIASWYVLGPVVAERDLGGAGAWGPIVGALGAGALGGGVLALRVRPRRPLVVAALGTAAFALPLALLALALPVAAIALGALICGAAMMLADTVWETTLQRHIPPEALSRVSAYDWFGSLALLPLGMVMWGSVAATVGVDAALWLAVVLQLAVLTAVLAVRAVRQLPPFPEPAEPAETIPESRARTQVAVG